MKSLTFLIFLLIVSFTKCSNETLWEPCKSGSQELCIQAVLEKIVVNIGKEGTNDDVSMEFCSDYNPNDCCSTPPLKALLSNDWSKGDTETWKESYFGPCKFKSFLVKTYISSNLKKVNSAGSLNVTSIELITRSPNKKVTEIETFQCGAYFIGGEKPGYQKKDCSLGPIKYFTLDRVDALIGKDGTRDAISLKICSDVNKGCCETELTSGWSELASAAWTSTQLGFCGKTVIKVKDVPLVTLSKGGKDGITINNLSFTLKSREVTPVTIPYACNGVTFSNDCTKENSCIEMVKNCKKPLKLK